MASVGLNVGRNGEHDPRMLRQLGVSWIRVVAMPTIDLVSYFQDCQAQGLKVLLVLARESEGKYEQYAKLYTSVIDAVEVGNEPDISSPSSWTMDQDDLVALGKLVKRFFPTMPLVIGGLASGHPEWLDGMDLSWAEAVAVHPYLKDAPNPTDIEDLQDVTELIGAYRGYGKPVLVTEWGWWGSDEPRATEEVRDMMRWAAHTDQIEVFFYFCLTDAMVAPFGLLESNGRFKNRALAFQDEIKNAINSPWPVPQTPSVPVPPTDLRAYARDMALQNGYPPVLFERQIQQESGFNPGAYNAASGASGIAQLIPRFHPGVDPWDPHAALAYAAKWMASLRSQYGSYQKALIAYNWGPGNLSSWDGQPSSLPAETRHYLDVVLGTGWPEPQGAVERVVYNRNEPAHPQEENFDCSQESLEWALWAYGRKTSDDWLEATMIAEGVMTKADGLVDSSGAGLAAFIRRQYGELGYDANNENPVTFDALAAEFLGPNNPYPALIGGRAWNHWSGLREYDAQRDVLVLANPADGHKGVKQTMTRQQFSTLGPFSMVRVIHKDVLTPAPDPGPNESPPPPPPVDLSARVAELEYALRMLRDVTIPTMDRIVRSAVGDD